MTNLELKQRVRLYWQIKNELDKLQEGYAKTTADSGLLTALEPVLKDKFKASNMFVSRQKIFDGMFYPEQQRWLKEENKVAKEIHSEETQLKIQYLEAKLGAVKEILGKENLEALERNERERILKMQGNDFEIPAKPQVARQEF